MSRIILGCMSYGSPQWQDWILPEEEAIKHIKFACVFDVFEAMGCTLTRTGLLSAMTTASRPSTLRMYVRIFVALSSICLTVRPGQMYSNGLSEIILGNAIKKLELPREEIVIMTKVCTSPHRSGENSRLTST